MDDLSGWQVRPRPTRRILKERYARLEPLDVAPRYGERPGPTSPPYPGHGMRVGERLREDWFPVVWEAGT